MLLRSVGAFAAGNSNDNKKATEKSKDSQKKESAKSCKIDVKVEPLVPMEYCRNNFTYTTLCGPYVTYDHVCWANESAMCSEMMNFDFSVCPSEWFDIFGDLFFDFNTP